MKDEKLYVTYKEVSRDGKDDLEGDIVVADKDGIRLFEGDYIYDGETRQHHAIIMLPFTADSSDDLTAKIERHLQVLIKNGILREN